MPSKRVKAHNIGILASGRGSNADKICAYFKGRDDVKVACIITNNPTAGVLEVAAKHGIPTTTISNTEIRDSDKLLETCKKAEITVVVLAGFLRKIPDSFIKHFKDKVVNIHPALLPKYGGKGMYGKHVHQAVLENKEKETGITIHLVNEVYDDGEIIFQKSCVLEPTDTVEDIASKVHKLEHEYFPKTIDRLLQTWDDL